ncbi:MAG: phenylalanine--tRNA ligase subunit alpha, partial [Pseudomonadota bacterium]|nr:phenylalanine--tRNA ligase subunit alpha [Pseudomonadota bacterium]
MSSSVNVAELKNELTEMIEAANDLESLEETRVKVLGKKGRLTDVMKTLGGMDPETRKEMGQALNVLKNDITGTLEERTKRLKDEALKLRLESERADITLSTR